MLVPLAVSLWFDDDQITAFVAIAASINIPGPGLGDVTADFRDVTEVGKLICVYAMFLGRLEVFTLLVLLTPDFWRR
jgi:trk system potassium uptake protein TrkH